ncbi:MAG: hypothetical protein KBE09_02345 [Candidatus Pacebacteria bacterium]|nr:hypothetical protein [Candidatus Paceibacterota bacterium]
MASPDDIERKEMSHSERIAKLRQAMYSRSLSEKIHPRDRHALDEIDYGVPTDFVEEREGLPGSMVAPRTIGAARTFTRWFLVASLLFFLAAAGAFTYYFVFGAGSVTAAPENIDIAVRGPLTVVSGEPSQLQIVVTNRNQAILELADLIIRYPEGTRSPADFLTDLPEQRISLGSIEPGGQRQGTVSAVFMGKEAARGNVEVELEYRVQNSNAIFVSKADYGLSYGNAPISIAIEGNKETVSGQRVTLTATIRAEGPSPLRDVLITADFPFGFTLDSVAPEMTRKDVWELGDLRPGDVRTIVMRGTMEGQEGDERVFRMHAGTRKVKTSLGIDAELSETVHHVAVARPFIGLTVAINKEAGEEAATVSAGEGVTVNILWKNNLSTPIANAVLVARLSGVGIPGTGIKSPDGFYRSADNTILFDRSTTRGALAELAPGASGSVSFSFTMPDTQTLAKIKEAMLDITVHAAGKRLGEANVPETLQSTAARSVKVATDVRLIGQGFYYQNPFGSVGPLPPKVDQETTYALVLTVANSSNGLDDVEVTAQLPPYVRWVGVYSPAQERLRFSAAEGTVTWNLGNVPSGTGTEGGAPYKQVAFAVGFTPSASQLGEEPELLREIVLTGTDAFTGRGVSLPTPSVTTNLFDDPGFSSTDAAVVE